MNNFPHNNNKLILPPQLDKDFFEKYKDEMDAGYGTLASILFGFVIMSVLLTKLIVSLFFHIFGG